MARDDGRKSNVALLPAEGSAAHSEYGGHFSPVAIHTRRTPAIGIPTSITTTTAPPANHQNQAMLGTGAVADDNLNLERVQPRWPKCPGLPSCWCLSRLK